MKKALIPLLLLAGLPVAADTVVASRTIRANSIIAETDLQVAAADIPDGFSRPADVVGQEARVAIYAGRPILAGDIGPPALVTRNQIVRVTFEGAGLSISTEGRALERGAVGDRVRLMNLSSRSTLSGMLQPDGTVRVYR